MKSRSKVGRALSMIALCCSIVYLLLRIFGMLDSHLHFKSTTAYASEWNDRRLSVEETIGLYGYSFPVTYTGINNVDQYFTAYLVGSNYWNALFPSTSWPTFSYDSRLFPSGVWGNFEPLWFYPALTQQYIDAFNGDFQAAPFLIYAINFGPLFESHSSLAHPNIRIDVNYQIPIDIICKEQYILFSRSQSARDSGWSYVQQVSSYSSALSQMVVDNGGVGYGQSVVTPYPQYVDSETGVNMGMIRVNYGSLLLSDTFTITGEKWTFNGCDAFVDNSWNANHIFLIYVQCPLITTNYTPPLPTTTEPPPVTTRPDFTTYLYTYDLSPLETNQINQIRIQNQQLQIQMAQLDGINYICWKLDQIYNQMVQNGDIPVDLISGAPVELYDSDVRNELNAILTSYTTSQLPDYEYEMDFVHRAFVFLWAEPWIAALGGLSLCCSVAAWIIFEGRRG